MRASFLMHKPVLQVVSGSGAQMATSAVLSPQTELRNTRVPSKASAALEANALLKGQIAEKK